ncbi:hypothetical protein DFJ74DRAFT_623195 [Hyaloraphidium curvatum]|nr:hypothetical protein DFJ74DRAFT_623195 [Hyaloraphidium curvatum]
MPANGPAPIPPGDAPVGPEDVLAFWFPDDPVVQRKEWYQSTPELDAEISRRFGETWETAAAGHLAEWASDARGALALVVLLDQFPRNMHRGTALAFSTDARAREVAKDALARGWDKEVQPFQRWFFYSPLEHSEDLEDQKECVRVFTELAAVHEGTKAAIPAIEKHHEIVERFGRFPHRNRALGRTSTPEEVAFLRGGGPSFGQAHPEDEVEPGKENGKAEGK